MFGFKKKSVSNLVELGDKVDPNGFRLVTSCLQPLLCPASYREEGGKRILAFDTEGMAVLAEESDLAPEWVTRLLLAYAGVVRLAWSRELSLQNFRWDSRCICFDKDGFRFQYVPNGGVRGKQDLIPLLIRQLKEIPTHDPRIPELVRELKRCRADGDGLALLELAAGPAPAEASGEEETAPLNEPAFVEESEAETTALNEPGFSAPADDGEMETTALDASVREGRGNTAYLSDAYDESETTVLSALPHGAPARPKFGPGGKGLVLIRTSTGERIRVRGSYFLVGADTANMDYSINNNSVSRHHATITYENGTYYIMDNKSTNGTRIEGVRVPPYEKVELTDGAILTLGNEVFQTEFGRG